RRVQRETTRSQNHTYKRPPLRSSGHRPHEGSMRPSHRSTGHRPHGPLRNPRRPNMNGARLYKSFFNQAPSYETRPFLKSSAVRTQYKALWVPTVNRNNLPISRKFSTGRRNFPTVTRKFPTASRKFTTSSTKNHTADMGRKRKAVKPSACWTWNPLQKLSNKGSSQNNIDDKGYWDSGCSRHMTGTISYLSDFEPFDGGYVSFGQEGFKITCKGTIKTECIVLGRNFKLLDDANILLRTPRQHNMYSINLNITVPHKDLTCLVAKASTDECILWHKRLGVIMGENLETRKRMIFVHKRESKESLVMLGLLSRMAKAVNTTCYVQNRVLVNKSQNKTPYELFNGRTPAIGFLKPFGCHVMILNTLDNLRNFEAKEDEGYFIGYLISSKAFRVFNKRTRRVEENLHVEFLEKKAIEKGAGPNWLFDIDSLTKPMNYVPVDAEPKKVSDALQDPRWVESMQEELIQFKIQKV
nr:ribonuclease H-like domain-containing protein [Tanacetum cinerariifolium]